MYSIDIMARPIRLEFKGAVYHITARGNKRRDIFSDDTDRRKFLEVLRENVGRHGIKLTAFVLMGNHYHLLCETPNGNLTEFMHNVQSHYTNYYNRKHDRAGHKFQGRYKAVLVDRDSYLVELGRYIHLNPVRAGFVKTPREWEWSSYRDYIGPRGSREWIDAGETLRRFGKNRAAAVKNYRKMVESGMDDKNDSPLDAVTAQVALGGEEFIEKIRGMLKKRGVRRRRTFSRKS